MNTWPHSQVCHTFYFTPIFKYLNITPRGVFLLFLMMTLIGERPEFNLTRTLFYFLPFIVFIQWNLP